MTFSLLVFQLLLGLLSLSHTTRKHFLCGGQSASQIFLQQQKIWTAFPIATSNLLTFHPCTLRNPRPEDSAFWVCLFTWRVSKDDMSCPLTLFYCKAPELGQGPGYGRESPIPLLWYVLREINLSIWWERISQWKGLANVSVCKRSNWTSSVMGQAKLNVPWENAVRGPLLPVGAPPAKDA